MSTEDVVHGQLQIDMRLWQILRSQAIRNVYDALVELITNSDDSYHRLYAAGRRSKDGGDILIEHMELRKGKPSYLRVRDKAEGMTWEEMQTKLGFVGRYTSTEGDRGFMGRGAKDCTSLGTLTYESIKDDRHYWYEIRTDGSTHGSGVRGRAAGGDDRERLGIPHGNGTVVTLELAPESPQARLPRFGKLTDDLPWHFALRDIISEESDTSVSLRKMDDESSKPVRLVFRRPSGELVCDEKYPVAGYEAAEARLRIWKADEPFERRAGTDFEKYGILVKGERRGIHENSFFSDEVKRDPNALRYFGRLDCAYLDILMNEYEERRQKGLPHPATNPRLVVDPSRRSGLQKGHPFVERLLELPIARLCELLAKDRERERVEHREMANEDTRRRLNALGKVADRFLREHLDEPDEVGKDELPPDPEAFAKEGVLLYPHYARVRVGTERPLTLYVKSSLLTDEKAVVSIHASPEHALQLQGSPFALHPHGKRQDTHLGSFAVRGLEPHETVTLTLSSEGLRYDGDLGVVEVIENTLEDREFVSPLEFEHREYSVREGRRKGLKLYAKCPDLVVQETPVKVRSEDDSSVAVRGTCTLVPVPGTNYAEGVVRVEGRRLKSKAVLAAVVNGARAECTVRVTERSDDQGTPTKIDFMDQESFGPYRAMWDEGKPNLLWIAAGHKSLRRYLGPPEKKWPGQSSPVFRVILSEIVAESVCRKLLLQTARTRPWTYKFPESSYDVIDEVLLLMQEWMKEFVARAHAAMLSDQEVKSAIDW